MDEGTAEGLFYAALEIRFGVEARMKEYLSVQDHIKRAKKEDWQVAKLGKSIQTTFKTGDRVARFTVLHRETKEVLSVLLYTPVTQKLQTMTKRLGKYLHSLTLDDQLSEQWWSDFRAFLESAWREFKKATSGQLLGVPLIHKQTRELKMTVQFEHDEDTKACLPRIRVAGDQVILKVEYLEELPDIQALH